MPIRIHHSRSIDNDKLGIPSHMLLCSVLMKEEGIRLQKFLAERGVASRRKCAEHILAGRVRVNGRVVREPGFRVAAEDDGVSFDRHKLEPRREVCRTILMNKPRGYICSAAAGQRRGVWSGRRICEVRPHRPGHAASASRTQRGAEARRAAGGDAAAG